MGKKKQRQNANSIISNKRSHDKNDTDESNEIGEETKASRVSQLPRLSNSTICSMNTFFHHFYSFCLLAVRGCMKIEIQK